MIKRTLKIIVISGIVICLIWSMKITEITDHKLERTMSSNEGTADGWKFNTPFPVDLVYTWVNGSDPRHIESLEHFKKSLLQSKLLTAFRLQSLKPNRFADIGGLRYSLRSVEKYANWIRHVFIVTNGQIPHWLNLKNTRVTIVNHEEIFDNPEDLPTFSSPAIEHNIHKIRSISDKFIYMNDDIFFGRNVSMEDFYTELNGTKIYLTPLSPATAQCSGFCKTRLLGNDVCDDVCNYDHCAWDGGDCYNLPKRLRPKDTDDAHSDFTVSLFYTHAVLNRAFGHKERHVVSHAPMFIDKTVNEDMFSRFSAEIKETCSHKVRSNMDFQFGFSYMNFFMEGNNNSTRLFNIVLYNTEIYLDEYPAEKTILDAPLGEFNMVFSAGEFKFVCINDDIDYSKKSAAAETIALLQENYDSLFPNPSSFEINT